MISKIINGQEESVSGSDGYEKSQNGSVKMPDGTLICWGEITLPGVTYSAWGGMYSYQFDVDVSFKESFVTTPAVTVTNRANASGVVINMIHDQSKITSIGIMRQNATGYSLTLNYIAVGRWK